MCKLQNCNATRQFVLFRANAFRCLNLFKKKTPLENIERKILWHTPLMSYEFELKHHTFSQTENQKFSDMNILEHFITSMICLKKFTFLGRFLSENK